MLQPTKKIPTPDEVLGENKIPTPQEILGDTLKKKESTESTSTTPAKSSDSVQTIGSLDGVGSNGFPSIDQNLGVPGLKPDLKTVEQLANPPKIKQKEIKTPKDLRLANETDFKEMQKQGIAPPNSELRISERVSDTSDNYDLQGNLPTPKAKKVDSVTQTHWNEPFQPKNITATNKELPKDGQYRLPDDYSMKIKTTPEFTEDLYNFTEKDKAEIKKNIDTKIEDNDLDIEHPYLYFSSYDKPSISKDDFVTRTFGEEKLKEIGINIADFDGFLNKKGYKKEFLDKESKGMFEGSGYGKENYNIELAKDIQKNRLLNLYIGEINGRNLAKRKLEKEKSNLEKSSKQISEEGELTPYTLFDQEKLEQFVETEMPTLSKKLKEVDSENKEIYAKHKSGDANLLYGTEKTFKKIGYGFIDKVNQISATVFDKIGADEHAQGLRFLNEQRQISRPNTRDVGYAKGKTTKVGDTNYLVTDEGRIIDQDLKIDVTDLLKDYEVDSIKFNAKEENKSDYTFSPQGSIIQFGGVVGDMIVQLALTKSLSNVVPSLAQIPLSRGMSSAIITQSALGYTQGVSETYKQLIDAGVNEKDAKLIANEAGQNMALLYGVTAPLSPQTKATQAIFGKEGRQLIKEAVKAYTQSGKKGFLETLKSGLSKIPRHAVDWVEEGLIKEGTQELTQQSGESYWVNAEINRQAGQHIVKDTINANEVINTLIQTTLSGGLAVVPNLFTKTDKLKTLSDLSKDANFDSNLNNLVEKGVVTKEQANVLKKDVQVFSSQIGKIPKNLNKNIAMDVMTDLQEIQDLEAKKKTLDKSFHEDIDAEIETKRTLIKDRIKFDALSKKEITELKSTAKKELIQEAKDKDEDVSKIDNAKIVERANKIYKTEQENLIKEKDAKVEIPITETKPQAEVPQQTEGEKVKTPPVEDVVATSVSKEEYADFIDNDNVSGERLNSIAEKVKNKEKLSEQENAIFVGKTSEINKIIADAGKENGDNSTKITQNQEVSPVEDVVATSVEKKQPTNAKEWEEQNFTKDEIEERRKFGLTPEQEWEPTFRGTSLSEWEDIQKGGDFKSEGLNGLVFTTPSAELAKQSGKGVDAEVIIEFKPESKSKMREGDSKYDSKEYYGDGLNKEDVLRVTDKNGNVIYEATSPTNNPVNGNLSTRTSDVGESRTTKQESPAKENLPSSVDVGKSEGIDPKSKTKNPLREKSSEEIADELGISEKDYLDLKAFVANEPSSGIFNEYLSADTIADVFGDGPINDQQYEQMVLLNAVQHGNSVLEKARSIFGENYMSKTLEFLQNVKLGNFEKAMVYAALENEIDTLVKSNPSNKVFLATQRLIYADSQANLRNSSKGLNAGRLRRIHNAIKNGYDIDKLTIGLIKPEQQEAKQILKDAIPTGDNLNKASEQEENEIDSEERIYTQNELDEAIEKARREFEEENLGFEIRESKVKIKKEDALEQIRKIKDNWKKASKDGTLSASLPYAKQIIAVAPDVIKLAKLYSQIAGMKTIDIVQAIRNDVSEVFDLISEKDIKGILKKEYGAKSRKMSEATKRKIYVKLLNKAIESLDAQIEKRSRDVVKKVDKYANDSEIQNLRDLKKQRQEELEKIDPSYSDKKKLSNAIDSVNKSISELENKIADSDFSEKQKEVKEVDKKLAELREKRDSLRKEYNKRKDEYKKSLVSEDEKRKMQESQKITVLEKRLQDLKDKKAKDTLGKSSVWNAEISDLQNQIKQEKQRQEEPKKPKIKDVVKQALIDAGFSREITVTKNAKDENGNDIIDSNGKKVKIKETKQVLDWNKLTGRMNSVEALRANVEGKLKEQGYTDSQIEEISNELETEYKRLTEYIADKALTELERRNQIPKPVNRKSDLDRLVDYHNKGLFGESAKGYERLINKIVGITKREQDVLDKIESEIEKIKNLREVKIDGSFPDAQSIESQASHIAKSIRNIIAWSNLMNSRIDKQTIDVISDIAGISRAAVLGNLYNALQNIYSNNRAGYLARKKFELKGYWTRELNDAFNELKSAVTSDVLINRGLDFGDVVSPFSHHSIFIEKLKDYIEKKYPEGRKRRMIIGVLNTFEGRLFLNVMDSRFKSKIVNIDFVMNLVDVLTSERAGKSKMTKEEAVNFVSESLTGVNLEKAKVLAKKFIDDVNAMKEGTLLKNEDNIKRLAFDIVRENLTSGNNFTMDEINDIYQASMKSGGANIGHESNNIISESLKNLNNWIEKKVEDAMKEKDYDKATKYATYAFISKNITYPYMSGGLNWAVLEAEAGTPLGLATGAYKSYKNKNIDLLTDVGKKRMKEDLINKRDAESKLFRGIWGTSIAISSYLAYYGLQAVSGIGDDDEENKRIFNKYLREHPEQRKIFDKFSPELYAVSLSVSDERLSKYLLNKMGYKTDQNDNVFILLKSLQNKNSSTPGALGVLLGQIVSTPGAWRILRDSKRLFRELQGEPMAQTEQRVTSFLNGYFKGALVDYLGLRPGTNYDLEKVKKEIQNKKTDFTNYTNGIANDINSGKITKEDAAKLVKKKYEDNDELLDKAKEIIQNSVNDKEIREGLKDADIWYMEMHNEKDIRAKAYIYYQNELKNNASKTDKNFDKYMNIALYGIDEDYYKKFIDLAIEYKDVEEQKSKKKPVN